MRGAPAKTLARKNITAVLQVLKSHRNPLRNEVIFRLSINAGLRACEIANLTWLMVLNANSKVGTIIELPSRAAKGTSGRRIPIHADLLKALVALLRVSDRADPNVILSERGSAMTAKSVVNWFARLYQSLGLQGCSSHSGRRTFVTEAARMIHRAGGSLRDVQELAGHRSIKTIQGYIEGDSDAQRRLLRLLFTEQSMNS